MKLNKDFYVREDVVSIAKELLGKIICTQINGITSCGIITETEAYAGAKDKASHAYNNRRTKRTETMFLEGGVAYVYLCYGMHHLFNVVTNKKDIPDAVLIRGIHPLEGIEEMKKRRNKSTVDRNFSSGPATLSQALGLQTKHDTTSLLGDTIWLEDRNIRINEKDIIASPRIGVDYAQEDALLKYNFKISARNIF